jgi:dCMP deaminase
VKRPNLDEYYLSMLRIVASRSTCVRRRVGAIIIDAQGHVLSMGYNGVPAGVTHCIDQPCPGASDKSGDNSRCWAVHAEQNAILQCLEISRASTIYVTCTPCFSCAKVIANTPIKRIVSLTEYTDTNGLQLLLEKGIRIDVLSDDNVSDSETAG